jgi:hypothetical protein
MIRRKHYVSLADVIRLKTEKPSADKPRTPQKYLKYTKNWHEKTRRKTLPADAHGEEWDDYDRCFLIDSIALDISVESIALHLGRTYDSVEAQIYNLRQSGDIPPLKVSGKSWLGGALAVLTPEEQFDLIS